MRLTKVQVQRIAFHMNALAQRVQELRREDPLSVPNADEISLLFTDPDDYSAEDDDELNYLLAVIQGMSIGLGLDGPDLLFEIGQEGLEEHEVPDVSLLVVASERALLHMNDAGSQLGREIVNELGKALSPFKGREWR